MQVDAADRDGSAKPNWSDLDVLIALVDEAAAKSQTNGPVNVRCNADLVCMKVFKDPNVRFKLTSYTNKPLSVRLFLRPASLEPLEPPTIRLLRRDTIDVVSFAAPVHTWGYEYRTHYGHEAHAHDDSFVYTLPYRKGASFPVSQSHTNVSTHRLGNRYAIDWSMPIGEPVYAARAGLVVSTYAGSDGSVRANHVWIRHADGTIGKYLHLDHNGVAVREGDRVGAGTLVGASGNTGFSGGPHLHFSVSSLGGEYLYQTFNLKFATTQGVEFPVGGESYTRPAD